MLIPDSVANKPSPNFFLLSVLCSNSIFTPMNTNDFAKDSEAKLLLKGPIVDIYLHGNKIQPYCKINNKCNNKSKNSLTINSIKL